MTGVQRTARRSRGSFTLLLCSTPESSAWSSDQPSSGRQINPLERRVPWFRPPHGPTDSGQSQLSAKGSDREKGVRNSKMTETGKRKEGRERERGSRTAYLNNCQLTQSGSYQFCQKLNSNSSRDIPAYPPDNTSFPPPFLLRCTSPFFLLSPRPHRNLDHHVAIQRWYWEEHGCLQWQ